MRTADQNERTFLGTHGYVHVPGLLALHEVDTLRAALTRARRERAERLPDSTCFFPYDDDFERVFEQLTNVWQTHLDVAAFALGVELARFVESVTGANGWRLYRDHSLMKPIGAKDTPLHVDGELWSFDGEGLSVWIALDAATPTSGAMRYQSRRTTEVATRPAAIGDAYVHLSTTVHGACANRRSSWRHAYVVGCMPGGADFNGRPNVLPKRLLDTLQVGEPLSDDSIFPELGSWESTRVLR